MEEFDKVRMQLMELQIEELRTNWAETIRSKDPLLKEINRLRKANQELKRLNGSSA